jgi:predicted O-methyltransferase YrrM
MSLRPSAKFAASLFNYPLTVIEVGVYLGENALAMLENMQIQMLYLVDPYELNKGYDAVQEGDNLPPEDAFRISQNLIGNRDNVRWIKETSEIAALRNYGFIDYIYIDGDHRYESVRKDLINWWPKLKPGGVIGGHDYHSDFKPEIHQGVDKAVDEFFGSGIQTEEIDWWVVK